MGDINDLGTGKDSPLELLSGQKNGTGVQLRRKYIAMGLSTKAEKRDDSDEDQLRNFFSGYESVILAFLSYVEDNNIDYAEYFQKISQHKDLFTCCRKKLHNGEMNIKDFLGKVDRYEQEKLDRERFKVAAYSMNVLSNR